MKFDVYIEKNLTYACHVPVDAENREQARQIAQALAENGNFEPEFVSADDCFGIEYHVRGVARIKQYKQVKWCSATEDDTYRNCNLLQDETGRYYIINNLPDGENEYGSLYDACECNECGFVVKGGDEIVLEDGEIEWLKR